jgi:hypothetical protein
MVVEIAPVSVEEAVSANLELAAVVRARVAT